ncbi:Dienelactone hydrolase domain-containing protein [Plasmodiophora brassicae]|uniref:Dienelactone hydrolase domain-containing protein n=1 Tax=Plasmodiophora brassicae TaxID=37360 RepID=A0A0G4J3T9_PLABS|nr:hypothetical protein PBRA_008877 [Plasmodiophora brassicae]SPR01686.1 unnamed protein product [Plasmodiophora brassicae]
MASLACCAGTVDSGTPTGSVLAIGGISCYVACRSVTVEGDRITSCSANRAVVIATDIFGYKLSNGRLLADQFATAGYVAVVPDLFNGNEVPPAGMHTVDALVGPDASNASLFAKGAAVANYPGVAHGFAIRGDWTDPNVADKRQQALQNAITFFSAVLGDPTGT